VDAEVLEYSSYRERVNESASASISIEEDVSGQGCHYASSPDQKLTRSERGRRNDEAKQYEWREKFFHAYLNSIIDSA
jgi:hypothetical protein